ncbi:hypothetical protein EDC94DRAFT_611837 [Helicostylum pulchrum]|nr:hypothetical protein EDC94DRAFT_611837 [Helicostylum pulchrum]
MAILKRNINIHKLHAGAVVHFEDKSLLLLTCEVYCRFKSADAHSETSMKYIPASKQSLLAGICEESDVYEVKNKLKTGGYHMNVLSIMSVEIGSHLDVNIRPSTNLSPSTALSIIYPESNIREHKETMEAAMEYIIEYNINYIRQLVSGFGNISTHKPYRASIDLLEKHETLMPATVFNLCDFPGNGNYGVSDVSVSVLCSRFLNLIASNVLLNLPNISKARFNDSLVTFRACYNKQTTEQWNILSKFVHALQIALDSNNEVNTLSFGKKHAVNPADVAGSRLSTVNKQLKENVKTAII